MAVLDKVKKTVNTGAKVGKAAAKGVGYVASKLTNTASSVANFLTGGPREQTYGYFAEFFPDSHEPSKEKKQKKPELSFDDICISTETIIATTNWKVDINELFNHLSVTEFTVVPKKRGRKSKDEKKEEKLHLLL